MKQCNKCKALKPFGYFDKDANKKDGHATQCKDCRAERRRSPEFKQWRKKRRATETYKARRRQTRSTPKEREQARTREAKKRQLPGFKERERAYRNTPEFKQKERERRLRNRQKVYARNAVSHAVRNGVLPHPSILKCEWIGCDNQAHEYHHCKGYDKEYRLVIQALCKIHHAFIHRKDSLLHP